ncbi:DUF3991 domain-containing protein [Weissella viridescens]|uniref:DUF3991 domain-containing protein n=1 Tax=Weissella viridescens TaxID=1629 RepID=UPI003AF2AAB8
MTSPVQQYEDKDLTNQRVSIEEYLEYQGHEIGKVNSGGYAKIDDHDSLFVNLSENHFTWFAHNTGGGIFQLMSELDGISDYDTQLEKLNEIKAERKSAFEPRVEAKQEKKPFDINDFEIETLSKESKQYLTEVRKIHPILVNALAKSGFLVDQKKDFTTKAGKQVTAHNLAYLWKDAYGQPVGADVQATRPSQKHTQDKHQGYWKGILPNSPAKKFGFSFKVGPKKDVPDKLVVVEAPIDAISHWQMHVKEYKQEQVQVAYLSLSGVKSSVLNQYIRQNYWDEHQ